MYKNNLKIYKYLSIIIFIMTIINMVNLKVGVDDYVMPLSYKTIIDLIIIAISSGHVYLFVLIPLILYMIIYTPFHIEKGKIKLPCIMLIYSIIDIIWTTITIILNYMNSYFSIDLGQLIIDIYFIITLSLYYHKMKNNHCNDNDEKFKSGVKIW